MFLLYNLVISILFVIALPYFLFRGIFRPGSGAGFKEKLGFIPGIKRRGLTNQPNIWLHAVSVGEILASLPLIKLIQEQFTNYQLVISTGTFTGQEVAKKRISGATFIYFPLDVFWVVSKVVRIIKPVIFIVAESEIWPNFFKVAHSWNIPIVLFNGRVSARSYNRYKRMAGFFRLVLNYISSFGMQTELDAQRIISLGGEPSRIKITGNTKFDALEKLKSGEIEKLREELKISPEALIFVAGSTHPGEEEIVLNCFLKLKNDFANLHLILCPRHLERLTEMERLINCQKLSFSRRTQLKNWLQKAPPVILLDTLGELAKVYSLASVVFVGGSLIPKGGQNILEPINFGKPTIFGPYISNFQEIATLIKDLRLGFQIQNGVELYEKIFLILKDESLRENIKNRAVRVINSYRGASLKNFELIEKYLAVK